MLDVTGRDRFFEQGLLREEAIDVALTRYGLNTPPLYERLIYIDVHISEHRQKTAPKRAPSSGGKRK